jgi:hypothetical protein
VKIEPKAFLAIERSMIAAMRAQWDKLADSLMPPIVALVDAGKWGEAEAAVNRLSLDGIVRAARPELEELAVSALLFGAHRVTGDVRTTTYAKNKTIPRQLAVAID